MTTSTFAPFKAIKVTCEVEWDLDDDFPWEEGKDNKDRVPSKNYTVELDAQELLDEVFEDEKMYFDFSKNGPLLAPIKKEEVQRVKNEAEFPR